MIPLPASNMHWRLPTALFVSLLAIFMATASRSDTSVDVYDSALGAWRIAETGAPWLDNFDFGSLGEADTALVQLFIHEAPNGHTVVHRSPGTIAAAIPAYALVAPESFSLVPQALTAALLAAIAMLLLYLALIRTLPARGGAIATLALALTTPVWSVAANGMWPHTLTLVGVCGMAWAAATGRWWLVGLFGGVALWGRIHVSLIVAILGLGVAVSRRRPRIAFEVGSVSAAAMLLASVWTHWMYGRWAPTGGYVAEDVMAQVGSGQGNSAWGQMVNELGIWIAPDRGVLIWTPVVLILTPAVVRSWRDLPDWVRWLFVGGAVYTLAQAWYSPFHGGDAFYGYRLGLEFVACATPAFAMSWKGAGRMARALVGPVLGLQLGLISLGAVADGLYLSQDEAWSNNVFVAAAVTVPALWMWLAVFIAIGALGARMTRSSAKHAIPTGTLNRGD